MRNRETNPSAIAFPFSTGCELLEAVLEELGIGLIVVSRDYRTLWANQTIRSQHGNVEGQPCYAACHGDAHICPDCPVRSVFEEGSERVVWERSRRDPEGNLLWFQATAKALRDPSGAVVAATEVIVPITEQKRFQEALQAREARLQSIIGVAPIGIGVAIDRVLVEVNDHLCRMTGYAPTELLHQPSRILYRTDEDHDFVASEKHRQIQESGIGFIETRWVRKDGTLIHVHLRSTAVDPEDWSKGIIFTALDTTGWKATEEALRRSEEKYRQVVEHANEAIFIAQDGHVKFPNPQMLRCIGYSEEELAREPFVRLIHPEDRGMVLEQYRRRLMGEELSAPYTFRALSREGEILWVELTGVPIQWEGRPASLTFARDISEQKKLETQLIQSQKMEAVGTLAGGVAHDFNNLLTGILGFTSLILSTLPPSDPNYIRIQSIEQLGKSGADLTKQLLGFARGGRYDIRTTDLNHLVQRTIDLFGRTRKEVQIHPELQPDLPKIEADGSQIEQVIVNLFVNAFQAMPNGGDLILGTRKVALSSEFCQRCRIAPGDYVQLTVTDTGEGMDEETQRRVFEPFFTTKTMGRGTGLGLASVYGIVKNHGGMIEVTSKKDKGTTFSVYFPASTSEMKPEDLEPGVALTGDETILLVDDEEVIRTVGREILSLLGYRVLTAQSGAEALEIYRDHHANIDLVILDVAMPGMMGGETFDRLREVDPSVRVLVSSGYSVNGQAEAILKRGGVAYLQKPYTVHGLSVKVRAALQRPRRATDTHGDTSP